MHIRQRLPQPAVQTPVRAVPTRSAAAVRRDRHWTSWCTRRDPRRTRARLLPPMKTDDSRLSRRQQSSDRRSRRESAPCMRSATRAGERSAVTHAGSSQLVTLVRLVSLSRSLVRSGRSADALQACSRVSWDSRAGWQGCRHGDVSASTVSIATDVPSASAGVPSTCASSCCSCCWRVETRSRCAAPADDGRLWLWPWLGDSDECNASGKCLT